MKSYSITVSKVFNRKIELQLIERVEDLCDLNVDVLVNPADAELNTNVKGELSYEIWNRGSKTTQNRMKEIQDSPQFRKLNSVNKALGTDVNAKTVYHVPLRPLFSKQGFDRGVADINAVVGNILRTAKEEKVKSVVIPPLGLKESFVKIIVRKLATFFREELTPEMSPFHVYLVVHTDDSFTLYREQLDERHFMDFPISKVKKEEWPSPQLRKEVLNLHSGRLDHDPSLTNAVVIDQEKAFSLATQFQPEISLQGVHLKEEQESTAWGGMLYRVLANTNDLKDANRAVIQYLYIWTKQPWFVSFWLNVVPLWILVFFSIYINTDIVFYNPLAEGSTDITAEWTAVTFLSVLMLDDRVFLIALISACFIILGVLLILSRKSIYVHSLFLIFFGILFSLQLAEFVLQSLPPLSALLETTLNVDIWGLSPEASVQTQVLWIPFLLLLLSFVFLLIYIFQPPIPYLESRHQMDYAPVFVYLKKEEKKQPWTLDYILYDKDHYFIEGKSQSELKSSKLLKDDEKPMLVMNTSWHSMFASRIYWRLSNNFWLRSPFLKIINCIVFISIFLLLISPELSITFVNIVQTRPLIILKRFVLPMTFFIFFLLITVFQPSNLQEEELEHKSNYLTHEKLRIFWNLESKPFFGPKTDQAQLKIREKIQNPFVSKTNLGYWETFYDSGTEDIWVKVSRKFGYKSVVFLIFVIICLVILWLFSLGL